MRGEPPPDQNDITVSRMERVRNFGFYWVFRIESTVRYLGVEVDDGLDLAERIEI